MSTEAPIRIRNFHGVCGARIFTSYTEAGAPTYHASDRANAAALTRCPACDGPLEAIIAENVDAAGLIRRRESVPVITAHAMEQRCLAARERLCAGAALDDEAIVCMGAEMEDGLTLEELAPLYGRTADTLREEIAAFTNTTEPNTATP